MKWHQVEPSEEKQVRLTWVKKNNPDDVKEANKVQDGYDGVTRYTVEDHEGLLAR
jgi:hypothetical protein